MSSSEEDENLPSCQCMAFKGYCSCIYPLYALAAKNNSDTNEPAKKKLRKNEQKKKESVYIYCTFCDNNFLVNNFRDNKEHVCFNLPKSLVIEAVPLEQATQESSSTQLDQVPEQVAQESASSLIKQEPEQILQDEDEGEKNQG